jgi:hypothetical protein
MVLADQLLQSLWNLKTKRGVVALDFYGAGTVRIISRLPVRIWTSRSLLLMLLWLAMAPIAAASSVEMHACCRRAGKHQCASSAADDFTQLKAAHPNCPYSSAKVLTAGFKFLPARFVVVTSGSRRLPPVAQVIASASIATIKPKPRGPPQYS